MPPEFKCIISDPSTGRSQALELKGEAARPLLGLKIGDDLDGAAIGLKGVRLRVTGGSDKSGFPMLKGVQGGVKARVLLTRGPGLRRVEQGQRMRVTVRGNTITEETYQVNLLKVLEQRTDSPRQSGQLSESQQAT